jgi:copper homeostasis protein
MYFYLNFKNIVIFMSDNHTEIQIEICAASLHSALQAQEGGAHRIELCAALALGGITPSFATLELVKQSLEIPTYVLIRPRGGDFCYSESEMQCMLRDIEMCKSLGMAGVVCGALHPNGLIHLPQTEKMLRAAEGIGFTFHRAFDRCKNPFDALKALIEMGAERILTSGQQVNALAGASFIKRLIEKADNQLIIMPGAGVSPSNILEIKEQTGAKEFHLSAKQTVQSPFSYENEMNDQNEYDETNIEIVKNVMRLVK